SLPLLGATRIVAVTERPTSEARRSETVVVQTEQHLAAPAAATQMGAAPGRAAATQVSAPPAAPTPEAPARRPRRPAGGAAIATLVVAVVVAVVLVVALGGGGSDEKALPTEARSQFIDTCAATGRSVTRCGCLYGKMIDKVDASKFESALRAVFAARNPG